MSEAGKRLIEGAQEALAVARGEQPAAAIWHEGHCYVPATRATTPTAKSELPIPPMMQHPPLRKSDTDPAWIQVIKLFQHHGMPEPPVKLRDELVVALEWAWYGHAVAALSNIGEA